MHYVVHMTLGMLALAAVPKQLFLYIIYRKLDVIALSTLIRPLTSAAFVVAMVPHVRQSPKRSQTR